MHVPGRRPFGRSPKVRLSPHHERLLAREHCVLLQAVDGYDLIINAALELLSANGYHGLTMTDVAARAGVSKATLYRRWAAKEDLVADAVGTLSPMPTPRYPGTSLRDDLLALMEQAGNCDSNSEIVTATYEMARLHPDLY